MKNKIYSFIKDGKIFCVDKLSEVEVEDYRPKFKTIGITIISGTPQQYNDWRILSSDGISRMSKRKRDYEFLDVKHRAEYGSADYERGMNEDGNFDNRSHMVTYPCRIGNRRGDNRLQ